MRAGNLRSRRAVGKFDLEEEYAVDRLAFLTSIDEGFNWGRVIFSEETLVSTDYNGSARDHHEPGRRYGSRRSGPISVIFWDWISRDEANPLCGSMAVIIWQYADRFRNTWCSLQPKNVIPKE